MVRTAYILLPLALAISACSVPSRIQETGETVTRNGNIYKVYVENFVVTDGHTGRAFPDQKRMMYVDSRYIMCGADCAATLAALQGLAPTGPGIENEGTETPLGPDGYPISNF